ITGQYLNQHGDIPHARSSHSVTAIGNHLYVFGGEYEPRIPVDNDIYQYNIKSGEWKKLMTTGEKPSLRIAHAATSISNRLYIFGGRTGIETDENVFNDLYSFDVISLKWEKFEFDSNDILPEKRSYHSMTSMKDKLYVFGGCGEKDRLNTLWEFDTMKCKWRNLPSPDKEQIKPRGGCGLVAYNNCLWVFGGFCGFELDDVVNFNLENQTWSVLETKISPRSVFAYGLLNGFIIGFGGEQDPSSLGHSGAGEFADDVILFDVKAGTSSKFLRLNIETDSTIEKRGWHAGDSTDNCFYVFGGNTSENTRDNMLILLKLKNN
ncbi:unnamed protein product, partial [Didymodactylos carnosus]